MQIYNAVKLAHYLLLPRLANAKCVVDATAGNGNDTLFLAANTAYDTEVWAFDIQQQALAVTEAKIAKYGLSAKTHLVLDSHENMGRYIERVEVVMFNLGYLPNGDHQLCTKSSSTMKALEQVLPLLVVHGLVSIIAYSGHLAGKEEQAVLEQWLSHLPSDNYTVGKWDMLNHHSNPPQMYLIEKVRSEVREGIASR